MRNSLVSILLLCLLSVGCSGNDHKQAQDTAPSPLTRQTAAQQPPASLFTSLTPAQAKQLIDSRKDLLIVDVRSPGELREGAIANSILVPFWRILRGEQTLPRDKPLLLVCAIGGRSYAIGQVLHRQGYPEVYSLSGGISAWKEAGLPLKY